VRMMLRATKKHKLYKQPNKELDDRRKEDTEFVNRSFKLDYIF